MSGGEFPAELKTMEKALAGVVHRDGTGLGLWVSKGIVEKHGGRILTRTRRGDKHGTVFAVWLPLRGDPSLLAPAN